MLELGLCLALVSAITVNWAYAREHDAAAELPPLSFRHWRESLRELLGARKWVRAFAVETVGFLLYIAALRLAPLALVQAVSASGIAALAVFASHGNVHRLSSRDMFQAELAKAGYGEISTELAEAGPFYYAEPYHQQYLAKNPNGYCGLGGTGVACPVGLKTA